MTHENPLGKKILISDIAAGSGFLICTGENKFLFAPVESALFFNLLQ
jgi:hypothetical protein